MILEGIKYLFRKRRIKKYVSTIPTGFLPLKDIHKATIILDVEDPNYAVVQNDISYWADAHKIQANVFFLDFRKLTKDELLLTSEQATIFKKNLNWFGAPNLIKVSPIIGEEYDLFISLTEKSDFCNKFLSKCSKARFKIGCTHMKESTYDIVISSAPDSLAGHSSREVFTTIKKLLSSIE